MKIKFSDKNMLYGSIITALSLLFIYTNSTHFKVNFIFIGVFQELLTLPFILLKPILLLIL